MFDVSTLRSGAKTTETISLGGVPHDPRMLAAADEIERLTHALWQAKADLDNAHREIMPHVHKLAHDANKVSQIVDPPMIQKEQKDG